MSNDRLCVNSTTGILSRVSFYTQAEDIMKDNAGYTAVIIDVDNFKNINEKYGITTGDNVLRTIGTIQAGAFEKFDGMILHGYFYADYFVSLWKKDSIDINDFDNYLCEQFKKELSEYKVTFHMGVCETDSNANDISTICDHALIALKICKKQLSNRYTYYNKDFYSVVAEEKELYDDMKDALANEEFVPWFQPQYNYRTGVLIGAEALVRWQHPEKGIISPAKFVPFFEKNDLIYELDKCVWKKACMYLRKWMDMGHDISSVSVNVSRRDLFKSDLIDTFKTYLKQYDLPFSRLHVEITESAYVEDSDQLIEVVKQLQETGIKVEMDDFGSGYSSLNMLKEVPVDYLKLDMGFMSKAGNQDKGGKILSSIVGMAHQLELHVIAEGVETKQQADYLKSIGCRYMQGYFFSKPLPVSEFEKLLENSNLNDRPDNRIFKGVENSADFLDATTQSTLLFNSFVGGAAIIEYYRGNLSALRINERFYEEVGINAEEYLTYQYNLLGILPEESRKKYIKMLRTAMHTGGEAECEMCIRNKGKDIWTFNRVRYLSQNGERYIFYLSVENITQARELMSEKAELTERLSAVMKSVPGLIQNFTYSKLRGLKCTFSSDNIEKMFGYDEEGQKLNIIDTKPENFIYPEDYERLKKTFCDIYKGKTDNVLLRYRVILNNNSLRWIHTNLVVIDRNDDLLHMSSVSLDMDEYVKNETDNEMYRNIILNTPYGVAAFKINNGKLKLLYANDYAVQLLGFNSEEFRNYVESNTPLNINIIRESGEKDITERFFKGERVVLPKLFIKRKDGIDIWLNIRLQLIDIGNKDYVCYAAFSDVTSQVEMAKIVSDQKKELEVLIENTPCGIMRWKIGDEITCSYVSDEYCRIFGISAQEFRKDIREYIEKYVYKSDRTKLSNILEELKKHPCTLSYEYRIYRENGALRYISNITRSMKMDNGEIWCYTNASDITNQRELESELNMSREEFDAIISNSEIKVINYIISEKKLYFKKNVIYNYDFNKNNCMSPDKLIEKGIVTEGSREKWLELFKEIHTGNKQGSADIQVRNIEGDLKWIRINYTVIFDTLDKPYSALIVYTDVTEQYEKIQKLEKEKMIMRTVTEHSKRVIYYYDYEAAQLWSLDKEKCKRNGLEEVYGKSINEQTFGFNILSDSQENVIEFLRNIREGKLYSQMKVHMISRDGVPRWYDVRATVLKEGDQKYHDSVVSMVDITAQHERDMAYAMYIQEIENNKNKQLYIEADITANIIEKISGSNNISFESFTMGMAYEQVINGVIKSNFCDDNIEEAIKYFSRGNLLEQFSKGINRLENEWKFISNLSKTVHTMNIFIQLVDDSYTGYIKAYMLLNDVTEQ